MDIEQDTHICLNCQATIVGLENYVHHKKAECPTRKALLHKSKDSNTNSDVLQHNNQSEGIGSLSQQHSGTYQSQTGSDHLLQFQANVDLGGAHDSTVDPVTGLDQAASQAPQYGGFTPLQVSHAGNFSPLQFGSPTPAYSRSGHHVILSQPQSGGISGTSQVLPPMSQHSSLVGLSSPSRGLTSLQPPTQPQHSAQHDTLGVEVSETVASLVSSTLSPTTNRTIDPNEAFYGSGATNKDVADFMSFFNSLELQSKWNFDATKAPDKSSEPPVDQNKTNESNEMDDDRLDHQKALKIASILNELAFSSDSEDFHVPSDAGDLLNSDNDIEDEDDHEEEQNEDDDDDDQKEYEATETRQSHTGGKWKPASYPSHPSPDNTRGKWKPSSKLQAMREAREQVATTSGTGPNLGGKPGGKLSRSDLSMSVDKVGESPPKTGGKWKPGQRPSGKWRPGEGPKYRRLESDEEDEMDEDDEEDEDEDYDRRGGKTLPGRKFSRGKIFPSGKFSRGKIIPEEKDSEEIGGREGRGKGGKIFPSGKLSRGKILPMLSDEEEDGNEKPDESPSDVQTGKYFCKYCNRSLFSKQSFERHIRTSYHQRKKHKEIKQKISKSVKEEEPIECTICKKSYNYKYNFARHLASSYHMRRAQLCDRPMLLDESCQILLLRQSKYQCHICSFFCSKQEDFVLHMGTPEHHEKTVNLLGPILCVRCKFACRSNEQILLHLESEEHLTITTTLTRPCVIKESRHKVKCPQCDLIVHSVMQLKKHLKQKHSSKSKHVQPKPSQRPFCSYCGKVWKSLFSLEIHIRRIHTKEKPFKCSYCMKSFADKYTLKLHNKSQKHLDKLVNVSVGANKVLSGQHEKVKQKTKMFKCNHCEFKCEQYSDLRPHYMECHADELHACDACGLTYVDKKQYESHMRSKAHQDQEEGCQRGDDVHKCKHCGKIYLSYKKKQLHELSHNYIMTEAAAKRKLGPNFGINEKYHAFMDSLSHVKHGQVVHCPECNKTMTRQNVAPHLRSHTKSMPFQCMLCVMSFSSSLSLRRHLMYHLDIRMHECKDCGKEYMKPSQLEQHKQIMHNPNAEKKVHCDKCDSSFFTVYQLKRHSVIHEGKLFTCEKEGCHYSTHIKTDLTTHMTSHSDARPFLCDECGWFAKTKKSLKSHRRTHSGERRFHCEYCEYKTNTKHHLHRHMRIHIGSRPYKCPYCEYTCNTLDNLQKHITMTLKHKGLFLYNCKMCSFGSNNTKDFKDHMFNEHGTKEKDIGQVCSTLGIYNETSDVKNIAEGECAIPVKERVAKGTLVKKRNRKRSAKVPASPAAQVICDNVPEADCEEVIIECAPVEEVQEVNDIITQPLKAPSIDHSYVSNALPPPVTFYYTGIFE